MTHLFTRRDGKQNGGVTFVTESHWAELTSKVEKLLIFEGHGAECILYRIVLHMIRQFLPRNHETGLQVEQTDLKNTHDTNL